MRKMLLFSLSATAIAGATVAVAQIDSGGAEQVRGGQQVQCCRASDLCEMVDSHAACDSMIIEHSRQSPRIDPDVPPAASRRTFFAEPPKHIEPAIDTVELTVLSCSDLPNELAPIPPGAITLEVLRWLSCEVEFVDACLFRSRDRVAWPRYSDGHLSAYPAFQEPLVGSTFRVRLEQRDEWLRIRGAEQISEPTGVVCAQ